MLRIKEMEDENNHLKGELVRAHEHLARKEKFTKSFVVL